MSNLEQIPGPFPHGLVLPSQSGKQGLCSLEKLKLSPVATRTPSGKMEHFIHNKNIRLYRKLLAEPTDAMKRQVLLKLLAEEEA